MKLPPCQVLISVFAITLAAGIAVAKPKPAAPCSVYFSVSEHDEITIGTAIDWLNKPQSSWYKKHGDRGKLAGICYIAKVTDAPPSEPLYLVIWGEHLESRPYTYTYQTTETETGTMNGTVTDEQGDTAQVSGTSTTSVPVQHTASGVNRYYTADGLLAKWDQSAKDGKGDFVIVAPLRNNNITKFTSASTSLLKDAVEQIRSRESESLAR